MNDEEHSDSNRMEATVRELLTEMKDASETIVDLAYASLMYNSKDMAEKVEEMDRDIDDMKFAIRTKILLAVRTKEDAREMTGVLQVASAADRISEAAGEIVKLLHVPKEERPFINEIINESDEKIMMTRISPRSDMAGNTIDQLAVEASTGTKIIAMKNRYGWIYNPDGDVKLRAGDDIIVNGSLDGFNRLKKFASGDLPWEFPEMEFAED
ncbi:MAG: PhoU domain-containing protein [Candidatus Methanomethylophilaceae archaeon]|nr:PhoU domain-containing protein [Candidatus Methanomethylophilaceae archaeon]